MVGPAAWSKSKAGDDAGVAVGGDRVAARGRRRQGGRSAAPGRTPAFRASMRRVWVTPSASRKGRQRKKSSASAASPRSSISSARAAVPAHPNMSAAAARKSSGRTAQISRSKRSPPRSSWSPQGFDVVPAEARDGPLRRFVEGGDLAVDAVGPKRRRPWRSSAPRPGGRRRCAALRRRSARPARARPPREPVEGGETDRLIVAGDEDRVLAVLARSSIARATIPRLLRREARPLHDQGLRRPRLLNQRCTAAASPGSNRRRLTSGIRPRASAVCRSAASGPGPRAPASRKALSASARPWRKCFQPS